MDKDEPDLINKEDYYSVLNVDDIPDYKVGDQVRYIRDGINKKGKMTSILFDLSKT